MKKFLLSISLFSLVILAYVLVKGGQADGTTDPFYIRFTTPKQSSLIIGTSRAAQGILPSVLNKALQRTDIFNYAFTVAHSPYGPVYYNSIRKKMNEQSKNGIFILAVDPWSISSTSKNKNDTMRFRENRLCVSTTPFVNIKPNYFYLLYQKKDLLNIQNNKSLSFLHTDGWLEISIDMNPESIEQNIKQKVKTYRENYLPKFKFSTTRLEYLEKTIYYLQNYGKVFLIRLPINSQIMELENILMADFNTVIKQIAKRTKTNYLDMTPLNSKFIYIDGNHLFKDSGREVSQLIANWILQTSMNEESK